MNVFSAQTTVPSQRTILGMQICDLTWAEAYAFADDVASMPFGQTVISFLNANNANLMLKDAEYRSVLERQLVFPDGHGIDIASFIFHGRTFPANLNGTDFVPGLLTYMSKPKRIALIGARADVLARAARNFQKHTPWHEFIPVADGYFDPETSDEVMEKVRQCRPDILLVAMGSPKQEKWIDRHVGPGHARLVLSVGALFDFAAEEVPRAPASIRALRLEWLYRLIHEPRRLWRRYIIGNPVFLYHVARERVRLGIFSRRKHDDTGLRPF